MVKEKVTITLDRSKADEARTRANVTSTSEVIDIALDHLIRTQRLRDDIAAYRRVPPSAAEVAIGQLAENAGLDDDTDWESVYAEDVG